MAKSRRRRPATAPTAIPALAPVLRPEVSEGAAGGTPTAGVGVALAVLSVLVGGGGGTVVMIVPVLVTMEMPEVSLLTELTSEVAASLVAVLLVVEGSAVSLDEVALAEGDDLSTLDAVLLCSVDGVGDGLDEAALSESAADETDGGGVGVGSWVVELPLAVELEVDLAAM